MPPKFVSTFFNGRNLTFRPEELQRLEQLKTSRTDNCEKCNQSFDLFRLREKFLCLGCWFDEAHAGHKIQRQNDSLVCELCHKEVERTGSLVERR